MNFFNPWLWLGMAMLGAPIWLHLQRRSDRNVVAFPTLQFLDESPIARKAPLSLREWLLFLLRALALALIVAAFSWPYRKLASGPVVSTSRVYLLDNTLSARAGNRFEQDKEMIVRELRKLDPATQAAVVELTSQSRVVSPFSDGREDAISKVAALQPSFERGPYLAAFRQAATLLDRAIGEKREIIFFGDDQANQWAENNSTPPFLRNVSVRAGRLSDVASLPNSALTTPSVQRLFLASRAQVRFNALLQYSGKPASTRVVVEANEREILRKDLDEKSREPSLRISALWEGHPTDWIEGSLRLDRQDDALAADDVAFFAAAPVVEGRAALLTRSPFIRAVLSPEVAGGHWKAVELNPASLAETSNATEDADVLVMEASFLQSAVARSLVDRYLENGRGVFIQVDRVTPIIQEALRKLGFSATEGSSLAPNVHIGKFLATHPMLAPFASPDLGNVFAVQMENPRKVEALRGSPILFSDAGDPLLLESTQGAGRVLLSTFSFNRSDTNWVVDPTFVSFLDLALQYLRRDSERVAWMEPGAVWRVALAPSEKVRELVLSRDGKIISKTSIDRVAQLKLPPEPGIYHLTFDSEKTVQRVAVVNPRPEESELVYLTGNTAPWTRWMLLKDAAPSETSTGSKAAIRLPDESRQLFWWWLVLSGIAILALETLLLLARNRAWRPARRISP